MSSSERGRALLGLGTVLAVALGTLWLGVTGHLDLYINPRYSVFTLVLAAIAVPAAVAGLVAVTRRDGHTHADGESHGDAPVGSGPAPGRTGGAARRTHAALVTSATVVTVAVTVAMLVLPPTTLSARTAVQRSVDSASLSTATGSGGVSLLGSSAVDTAGYGVKDWAALIRQTTDTSALVGKRLRLTGFVVGGTDGSFTLTRFVISCCAVDAQPVGIGVATTGTVPEDGRWVTVSGALAVNPDTASDAPLVIRAATLRPVREPSDPYEY